MQYMNSRVAIIIPVYNEEQVIGSVVSSVTKKFPKVICVDDGSIDKSSLEIEKTSASLVRHPINLGQGAAIQTGIEYALQDGEVEYFVTFDADGQHSLEDVLSMLRFIEEKKVDIVLGSRFKGSAKNISRSKQMLLKLAVKFSNATSGLKLTDTHNGLRLFNRHVAETLNITMPDMAHASEVIERVAEMGYRYAEVPVTISYTDYSKSKGQPIINAINIGFDMLLRKVSK